MFNYKLVMASHATSCMALGVLHYFCTSDVTGVQAFNNSVMRCTPRQTAVVSRCGLPTSSRFNDTCVVRIQFKPLIALHLATWTLPLIRPLVPVSVSGEFSVPPPRPPPVAPCIAIRICLTLKLSLFLHFSTATEDSVNDSIFQHETV